MNKDQQQIKELWVSSLSKVYPNIEKNFEASQGFLLGYDFLLRLYSELTGFSTSKHTSINEKLKEFQGKTPTIYEEKIVNVQNATPYQIIQGYVEIITGCLNVRSIHKTDPYFMMVSALKECVSWDALPPITLLVFTHKANTSKSKTIIKLISGIIPNISFTTYGILPIKHSLDLMYDMVSKLSQSVRADLLNSIPVKNVSGNWKDLLFYKLLSIITHELKRILPKDHMQIGYYYSIKAIMENSYWPHLGLYLKTGIIYDEYIKENQQVYVPVSDNVVINLTQLDFTAFQG